MVAKPVNGAANGQEPESVRVEKWAALSGRWKFSRGNARYLGPEESQARWPAGLALAAPRFRDGTIQTSIRLTRNERTAAGVVFGYQSPNAPYVTVQLGGFDRAYVIATFQPGIGWVPRVSAGSVSNLQVDAKHELRVRVVSQMVEVSVDDVDVLRHILPEPLEGSGFGVYAFEDAEVEFTDTQLLGIEPRVFVIMPFKESFDTIYRDVIRLVASEMGFWVVRVDEIFGPGVILSDIQKQIEQAHAVVAEISNHNPNVFYELGYAHALRKPAVLLVRRQEGTSLPFDIQSYRAIFYDDNIGGKKAVENNLKQHLAAILRNS